MDGTLTARAPNSIVNFIAFQVGWFACVLGGAWAWPWLGVVAMAGVVAGHVQLVPSRARELRLVAAFTAVGLIIECGQVLAGVYEFPQHAVSGGLAWMAALWAGFATTVRWSMRWVFATPLRAGLLGAAFGPVAFLAGGRLGAIELARAGLSVPVLAVVWSITLAVTAALTRRERE